MNNFVCFGLMVCIFTICSAQNCQKRDGNSGVISGSSYSTYGETQCWTIDVPKNSYIRLNVTSLSFKNRLCSNIYLKISVLWEGANQTYTYCAQNASTEPINGLSDVRVTYHHWDYAGATTSFRLSYSIVRESFICAQKDHFRCSNSSCVHQYQRCNGLKDCENGADEVGCEDAQDPACENLRELSGIIEYFSSDEEYSTTGWYDRNTIPTSNWWYRTTDNWNRRTPEYRRINKCWYINTPEESYVRLTVLEGYLNDPSCDFGYIEITDDNNVTRKICQGRSNKTMTVLGGVTVRITSRSRDYNGVGLMFEYHMESVLCARKNNFRCSEHKCISPDEVCDGKEDCENGRDEEKCGIPEIRELNNSRIDAINWLKSRQTNFGWGRNTHRAITALYLTGAAKFRGNEIEEEMMVKQLELKAVTSVMRNSTSPLSVNELSMYVNALSLTCHNYRNYYGNDLLKALGNRATSSASTSPGAYLTLCNAKWPLSKYNVRKLFDLLMKDTEYPFVFEIQAMTIMALSCIRQKTDLFYDYANATDIYDQTIENFIANQKPDGSFGNVHTTAMVSQAILSSRNKWQWNLEGALEFLMKNVNSSSADFLSIYLTLPLFRQKNSCRLG